MHTARRWTVRSPKRWITIVANYGELLKRWDSVLEEKGVKKVELDAADDRRVPRCKAADPIRDAWIADMEAQGLPGQELYDLVVKTLADCPVGKLTRPKLHT